MFESVRNAATRTKQFASEHPTLTACAVTGLVSWKLGRNAGIKALGSEIAETLDKFVEIDSAINLTYTWGLRAGQCEVLLDEAYNFIREQGLESEFVEFAQMPLAVAP
jgi:hypothetical protein